jgi:S-adenosylmethionine:diacylglycerol 3-amino-3-carboxypropyl transferase
MIWYSHINEDSTVERTQLAEKSYRTVCCVCGSGERLIALLDHPADQFYAIDINREALLLLQLKLTALKELKVEEYLSFIGHTNLSPGARIRIYHLLKNQLNHECRNYWNDRLRHIRNGILNIGHYEKYLARIRPILRLFLGSGFNHVFEDGDDSSYYFPKKRWQLLTAIFSNRWAYRLSGNRDISFIGEGTENKRISQGLNQILKERAVKNSYVFYQIFRGTLNDMQDNMMPLSLQKQHLQKISDRLKSGLRVTYIHQDYATAVLEKGILDRPDVFHSLSDIIGFENEDYIKDLLWDILGQPGHKAIIRSFLVNNIDADFFTHAGIENDAWQDLTAFENTRMYQVFSVKSSV